jgi:uncharacterized membrane protein
MSMLEFLPAIAKAKRAMMIAALISWCLFLIALRIERTGSLFYAFLGWNLFLACIPLMLSTALGSAGRKGSRLVFQIFFFGLWLLFLPNAPYILTDLLHLASRPPMPMWYDLVMLLSCSGTGLLVGYLSLVDIHLFVAKRFGPVIGWLVAVSSLLLTGFGIYLGRFERRNSWEVITNPSGLFFDIADLFGHPEYHVRTVAVTFMFGITLALGYVAVRVLLAHRPLSGAGGDLPRGSA